MQTIIDANGNPVDISSIEYGAALIDKRRAIEPEWCDNKAYCGDCGCKLPLKFKPRYCHKCGQKILWRKRYGTKNKVCLPKV